MNRGILFVVGNLDVGGAERHLVSLLPALSRRHFRPFVYTLTHKGRMAPRLEAAGIEVIEPPLAKVVRRLPRLLRTFTFLPLTVLSLCWLMIRCRPDIVHFFLPTAYLIGGLCGLVTGIKIRVMSRRSLNVYQRGHPILSRVERWLHRWLTAALGNSQAVVTQLMEEGIPANRLGLIYNGIDVSQFDHLPARTVIRSSLSLEQDALTLAIVANLIPYKGHRNLLEALGIIRGQLPRDWVLLCVGTDNGIGPDLRAYTKSLNLESHVHWLGERHDVPEILHASDIGLVSSHQEGFSNSVLEGMAAGLPMVVTDVGGNGEAVVDGLNGLVVPSQNPQRLGEAIARLAGKPELRRRMGKAGRLRVRQEFEISHCVADYLLLYQGLMMDKRRPICEILQTRSVAAK